MSDHVYKKIELTGSSESGIQQAIENAIAKASKSLHDMRWFEVIENYSIKDFADRIYQDVFLMAGAKDHFIKMENYTNK